MIMKFLIFCSIFVVCFTQICLGQEWSDFQRKHVLDPATESYKNFKRTEWNNWLKNREGVSYGTAARKINSVLIGDEVSIVTSFDNDSKQWINGSTAQDFHFWSSKPTPMYMMKLQNSTNDYDVYDCSNVYLFFVAKVDLLTRPIHFVGQADQIGSAFGQDTTKCKVIGKGSSNSLQSLSILSLTVFAILSIVSF